MNNYQAIDFTNSDVKNELKDLIAKLYNEKIDLNKIEKKAPTKDKKISINVATMNGNKYELIFYYRENADISYMIKTNHSASIDLSFSYINDFNYLTIAENSRCIFRDFNASHCFFDGDTDFSYAQLNGYVNFSSCIFNSKNVSFQNAVFENGFFDFRKTIFVKNCINFSNSNFSNGNISFKNARFGNCDVIFKQVNFGFGEISFRNAKFYIGKVNFFGAKLGNSIISFTDVDFGNCDVSFERAVFGNGEVTFWGSSVNKIKFINNTFKSYVNFGFKNISTLIMEECRIERIVYCDIYDNHNVNFKYISFHRSQNLGQIFINWDKNINQKKNKQNVELYKDNWVQMYKENTEKECQKHWSKDINQKKKKQDVKLYKDNWMKMYIENAEKEWQKYWTKHKNDNVIELFHEVNTEKDDHKRDNSMILQFGLLKENFKQIGYYDDEDEAYKAYMKYKTKALKFKVIKEGGKKLFYKLFGTISNYGTNPYKLFLIAICIIIFFGFLYGFLYVMNGINEISIFRNILQGQYFSTITFLTIGYKEMEPSTDLTRILAGIEGFIGLFIMSFFTVVVARKILR